MDDARPRTKGRGVVLAFTRQAEMDREQVPVDGGW